MKRVGVLGGTFDPPHLGHLWLAETAKAQLQLDEVIFMPVGQPVHKKGRQISAEIHRLTMVEWAIQPEPAFTLSTLDAHRPPPHTTASLLPLLRQQLGDAAIWLLIGGDSLRDFHTWIQPAELIAQCRLAVLPRPSVVVDWALLEEKVAGISAEVDLLDGPQLALSSTELRAWAAQGHPLHPLVPAAVETYLQSHALYTPA